MPSPAGRNVELSRERSGNATGAGLDPYEERATSLQNEAEILFTQGHYGAAEQKVRQLLELQNQVVGQQHPDFALGLSMLGELRFLQGDRVAAEGLFRRTLAIREQVLGRSHPDFAVSLTCLAGVLWRREALDEAEPCLREALAIRERALGPDHPESIQGRKELVRLLRQRGNWAGAQALNRPVFNPVGFTVGRDLSGDVVVLSTQLHTLGETMASTSQQMRAVGAPPSQDAVRALNTCRDQFNALQRVMTARIEALRVPNPPEIRLETLQDLASVLDDLVDAESQQFESEEFRTQALSLLDSVLALRSERDADAPPLRELQAEVRQLRGTIQASHWLEVTAQTEDLVEGAHPLVHLLILVAQRATLSDEDWAELHASVREAFGSPLAVAAARDRLILSGGLGWSDPSPVTPQPVPAPMLATASVPASAPHSRPNSSATPHGTEPSGLVRDLAVASLVPSMGTVIHLPTASPSEVQSHRLLRWGKAPNIVERAQDPNTSMSGHPEGDPRQARSERRAAPSINSGPIRLLHAFGATTSGPDARGGLG